MLVAEVDTEVVVVVTVVVLQDFLALFLGKALVPVHTYGELASVVQLE